MDSLLANQIYTDSENIDITNNQISLACPLKVHGEIGIDPRAYGIQFEMYAGTSGFAFLQNQQDGGQPIAIMSSLDRPIEIFGDVDIPNHCNKTEVDAIVANSNLRNYYK